MAKAGGRNFGLDALRVGAIAVVLANHGLLSFYRDLQVVHWDRSWGWFSVFAIVSIEWLFVLSGFLIGAILIRSFDKPGPFWHRARDFWLRRWFRTVPNYMLFLGINLLLVLIGVAQGAYSPRFVVFAQNLWQPMREPYFFIEAWSLALDEWFYLVLPLLVGLVLAARRSVRAAILTGAAVLVLVPLLLRLTASPGTDLFDWDRRFRVVTVYHLDATGWGVLAAAANRWWPGAWTRGIGANALLGLALMMAGILWLEGWLFELPMVVAHARLATALPLTLTAVGTALTFPWLCTRRPALGTAGAAVSRLSLYAYSIYLVHLPMMYVLRAALGPAPYGMVQVTAQAVVWLALTLATSAIIYHAFELPIFGLRDRYTTKVDARPFTATADEPRTAPPAASPEGA